MAKDSIESKVWGNISRLGIADKIIANGRSPVLGLQRVILSNTSLDTRSQASYNWVKFHDGVSQKVDTYSVIPYLVATEGPLKGTQPLRISLGGIERDQTERQRLAEGIWEGVTDIERDFITGLLLPEKIAWYEGGGSTDFRENARIVEGLKKIADRLAMGNIDRAIRSEDAAIQISARF